MSCYASLRCRLIITCCNLSVLPAVLPVCIWCVTCHGTCASWSTLTLHLCLLPSLQDLAVKGAAYIDLCHLFFFIYFDSPAGPGCQGRHVACHLSFLSILYLVCSVPAASSSRGLPVPVVILDYPYLL
jgi:hypothetical protein